MFRLSFFLAALAALAALGAATDIKFDDGDDLVTVLTSFGDEEASVSVLYKGPDADAVVQGGAPVLSAGPPEVRDAAGGYTNYTIPLTFKGVGTGVYTVTIGELSVTGSFVAAGFVILENDLVVSGDEGPGVTVGQAPRSSKYSYAVKAVGVDGSSVDISGTTITVSSSMKEVKSTSITSDEFVVVLNDYRVGSGSFKISFESDMITLNGASFETVLNVKQETDPVPPCVAMGGDLTTNADGYAVVKMFNLLAPPRAAQVGTVTITIGEESADWDTAKSSLSNPDQTVYFKISAGGKASITCDSVDAVIMGDDIVLSGAATAVDEPAEGLIAGDPSSETLAVFGVEFEVLGFSVADFGARRAQTLIDVCCTIAEAQDCRLTAARDGSFIGYVKGLSEDPEKSVELVKASVASCEFQKQLGVDCDDLGVIDSEANELAGAGVASAAGLATWTIILIAVVGAFALILVIVLGLWAVYRRSADQSESDYSSSGPLGVPDPSDLLYEQSIVRDIYGRGDFPDGGPSQAVAEQRAREAEMREEHPRPPSSSGVSRGAATDDASSTYSV